MMRANRLHSIVLAGVVILSGGSFCVKVMAWEDAPVVKEMCHNCDEESGSAQKDSSSDTSDSRELRQEMRGQQQEDEQFKQEMSRKYDAHHLHREGGVYAKQGNLEMALYYYKKAYELYPQDELLKDDYYQTKGYLLNEEGNRYLKQGELTAALESYRQAAEFLPQDVQTRLNLNTAQMAVQEKQRQDQLLQDQQQLQRAAQAAASAQARSAQSHGQKAMEKLSKEAASEEARKVFDTPGEAKEPLEPVKLKAMPLVYPDPVIAAEERTELISNFEQLRDEAREKRNTLEMKLEELGKTPQKDPVAIARTKQEISNNLSKEHFYNFKITRTLEKARELRRAEALEQNEGQMR